MTIAIRDLRAALQFLVVVVFDAERAADVVDHILIGRRVVAARRFVADGSADSQSASTSPAVSAGPAPVFFESRSLISARPDLADERGGGRSRLDGMP